MWLPDWFKERHRNHQHPAVGERLRILALSLRLEDCWLLERLGKQHHWKLRFAISPRDGFNLVSQSHFDLILCDRNQTGHPWREVMDRLAVSSPRSCIFLVSPLNDDYLWRDVLQQGGYDVLIRPLREKPVLHSIEAAVRFISPAASFCSH